MAVQRADDGLRQRLDQVGHRLDPARCVRVVVGDCAEAADVGTRAECAFACAPEHDRAHVTVLRSCAQRRDELAQEVAVHRVHGRPVERQHSDAPLALDRDELGHQRAPIRSPPSSRITSPFT